MHVFSAFVSKVLVVSIVNWGYPLVIEFFAFGLVLASVLDWFMQFSKNCAQVFITSFTLRFQAPNFLFDPEFYFAFDIFDIFLGVVVGNFGIGFG